MSSSTLEKGGGGVSYPLNPPLFKWRGARDSSLGGHRQLDTPRTTVARWHCASETISGRKLTKSLTSLKQKVE